MECRPDDDHADPPRRARGCAGALWQSRPGATAWLDAELVAARAEIARLEETVKEQAIELVALRGKRARAGRPGSAARRGEVEQGLLELIAETTAAGWSFSAPAGCSGLSNVAPATGSSARAAGCSRIEAGRDGGAWAAPGARSRRSSSSPGEWGEIDGSHRKLAHRGSYLARVWVSPSTVLRVLLELRPPAPFRAPSEIGQASRGRTGSTTGPAGVGL